MRQTSRTIAPGIIHGQSMTWSSPTPCKISPREQILCALALLEDPRAFLLAGDANQLIHPKFFLPVAFYSMFHK